MSYAGRTKYDDPARVARYAQRSARRDAEEWRLLASMIDALDRPPRDALDVPCGVGRIAARLLERGLPTTCADLSPTMGREAERRLAGRQGFRGVVRLDLEDPAVDVSLAADLVVCFRFLHHLPDAARRSRVLSTLSRLCRRHLLVSFHHPVSAHNATRVARRLVTGRTSDRYTLGVRRLRDEAAKEGLRLVGVRALAAYRRELWVAHLVPVGSGPSP